MYPALVPTSRQLPSLLKSLEQAQESRGKLQVRLQAPPVLFTMNRTISSPLQAAVLLSPVILAVLKIPELVWMVVAVWVAVSIPNALLLAPLLQLITRVAEVASKSRSRQPLYDWVQTCVPSSKQQLRLLEVVAAMAKLLLGANLQVQALEKEILVVNADVIKLYTLAVLALPPQMSMQSPSKEKSICEGPVPMLPVIVARSEQGADVLQMQMVEVVVMIPRMVLFLLNLASLARPDAGVTEVRMSWLVALHKCTTPREFVVTNRDRSGEYQISVMMAAADVVLCRHQEQPQARRRSRARISFIPILYYLVLTCQQMLSKANSDRKSVLVSSRHARLIRHYFVVCPEPQFGRVDEGFDLLQAPGLLLPVQVAAQHADLAQLGCEHGFLPHEFHVLFLQQVVLLVQVSLHLADALQLINQHADLVFILVGDVARYFPELPVNVLKLQPPVRVHRLYLNY